MTGGAVKHTRLGASDNIVSTEHEVTPGSVKFVQQPTVVELTMMVDGSNDRS